jgi:hypothetical protein
MDLIIYNYETVVAQRTFPGSGGGLFTPHTNFWWGGVGLAPPLRVGRLGCPGAARLLVRVGARKSYMPAHPTTVRKLFS